jgi:hypothetical protein
MGQLVFQATLGGQVNLVGPNTASTFNINVPAVAGNMVTTGDTGTVSSTMLASSAYTAPGTIGSGTPNTGAFTILSASGNVTLGDASTDTLNVGNGGIVKDASGNVGIGTASPAVKLHVYAASNEVARLEASSTSYDAALRFYQAGSLKANIQAGVGVTGGGLTAEASGATPITFLTNSAERMRIDSSGSLLVGTTSNSVGGLSMAQTIDARTRNTGFGLGIIGNASNTQVARFAYDSTAVGSINITSSTTSYGTSSDYRLKNTIAPMTGALAKVAALKPCTYKWNVDGSDGQGFIAHELAEICPDAVTGEKDAVDSEGNPQYQGIDTSFLVATLTAAIQEQQALITALTERITALEQA